MLKKNRSFLITFDGVHSQNISVNISESLLNPYILKL